MSKKPSKLSISFEGIELNALISNANEFQNCDGLVNQLFKINCIYLPKTKFSLTEGNFLEMYKGVNAALNGHRYPGKLGNEYNAMSQVKEILEVEYQRQLNKSIST